MDSYHLLAIEFHFHVVKEFNMKCKNKTFQFFAGKVKGSAQICQVGVRVRRVCYADTPSKYPILCPPALPPKCPRPPQL